MDGADGAPRDLETAISKELLAAYDATRARGTDRSVLCHAPFVSLNFDQSGRVTACCFNRQYVLGSYPESTVREIWLGEPAQQLRQAFLNGAEAPGCDRCFDQLRAGNFAGILMKNFDPFAPDRPKPDGIGPELPLVLEFELANTCTLECVMCGGHWSSAIRARREKLPPLRNPYDHAFVEQIEELLPTIAAARFLGGEPFLIPRYEEIWESLRRLNPGARVSITTSGAVLPDRSRRMIEHLCADIVLSLDGITPETYEAIRRNASFDQVMENFEYFRDYVRRRGTEMSIAVCPMTHNWFELRAIVDFCEARQVAVFFNTVTFPLASSLAGMDEGALANVVAALEAGDRASRRSWTSRSRAQWQGLLHQLHRWLEEKRQRSLRSAEIAEAAHAQATTARAELRRRIDAGRALPGFESLEESTRQRMEPYLEALIASSSPGTPQEAATCVATRPVPRVSTLPEFRAALEAAHLFHIGFSPGSEHERFRHRLDLVQRELTLDRADGILDALQGVDIERIYAFLASATDQQFANALRTLS